MSCIWSSNLCINENLFKQRFPELYPIIEQKFCNVKAELEKLSSDELSGLNKIFPFWEFSTARSGDITAKENGVFLHSSYNPKREVCKIEDAENYIFAGFGLGYAPLFCAEQYPQSLIVIIEPDPLYLIAAMSVSDWNDIFNHKKCIIITAANAESIVPLLEQIASLDKYKIITQNSQTSHAEQWFKTFFALFERNKQKQNINTNTLERFSKLWLKNSAKNIRQFKNCHGISIYKNILDKKISAIVIAAGPTLQDILPYLAELKKRTVLICVDTALKALLRNNIQPDFVLLIDPQYYAACHIAGLSAPESVLVTESGAYPSVMRFNCRKKVFCESLFPLGRYFELNLLKEKSFGKITAGGSVSTSCWDFAKYIGAKEIYMAGLDLGYPEKKTHIRGSTFEEKTHSTGNKLNPAENALCKILFDAKNENALDYEAKPIITDSKMKLFAWWFESQIAKESELKTYSLSKKSLFIPGITPCDVKELLELKDVSQLKVALIADAESSGNKIDAAQFDSVYKNLLEMFDELLSKAKKGLSICSKILSQGDTIAQQLAQENFNELTQIDSFILGSEAKNVASLVFPTERQLEAILKNERKSSSPVISNIIKSRVIYSELISSIKQYQKYLK